jgi:sulfite oxidase
MVAWDKREDMIVHEAEPYNAEPPRSALAGGPLTPVEAFYARNHAPVPRIHPDTWRVRFDGLLDRPQTYTLERLRSEFEAREVVATLQCAGNRRVELMAVRDIPGHAAWRAGAISTARWSGVSLADVLRHAGLRPGAEHIAFTACDVASGARPPQPFGGSIPVSKATSEEVLLAWAMNGRLLPQLHGGPVRLVVPGYIGARSVKWVERITAQESPSGNYYQAVDYRLPREGGSVALGPVAVNADILLPDEGAVLRAGPVTVSGYAFGGPGIARVDVSVDRGRTWCPAELDPGSDVWAWRQWSRTVELPPGEWEIVARAWDTAGDCQPESPEQVWNPGGYANNSWPRAHVTVTG